MSEIGEEWERLSAIGQKPDSLSTLPSQLSPHSCSLPPAPEFSLTKREFCRTPGEVFGEYCPTGVKTCVALQRLPWVGEA